MGNCSCNAVKTISEENHNEIPVETQTNEKRRGKNALIISNAAEEMTDNVEYDDEASITGNDIVEIKKALGKHFIFSQLNSQ